MIAVFFGLAKGSTSHWFLVAFALTQEPGRHIVEWWVDVVRPGFEEQMGYIYFVPLIQWLVYAAVVYAILCYRNRMSKAN
jgi:hypothetical protein